MAKIVIYSTAYCPYCIRAKALLDQKEVIYEEVRVDQQPILRREMMERSGGRQSVPQIFIDNKHIGGCDELLALDRQAALDPLLSN
tara:strand:- start:177 stop:434 length:258 start_codon:yes stop_codon:yes gene_type:complete